jgi:hypothetical protein
VFAGTVVSGIAVGLVFRGGLSEISRLAELARRAEAEEGDVPATRGIS